MTPEMVFSLLRLIAKLESQTEAQAAEIATLRSQVAAAEVSAVPPRSPR